MLILVLILVLKDIFQVLVLGGQILVLVLGGQVLVNIPAGFTRQHSTVALLISHNKHASTISHQQIFGLCFLDISSHSSPFVLPPMCIVHNMVMMVNCT